MGLGIRAHVPLTPNRGRTPVGNVCNRILARCEPSQQRPRNLLGVLQQSTERPAFSPPVVGASGDEPDRARPLVGGVPQCSPVWTR
jgi:hypothetical protein